MCLAVLGFFFEEKKIATVQCILLTDNLIGWSDVADQMISNPGERITHKPGPSVYYNQVE